MKATLTLVLLAFLSSVLTTSGIAQRKSNADRALKNVKQSGDGPITQGDEVVGYFFLFSYGKAKKGDSEYRLRLFNAEFQPTHDHTIKLPDGAKSVDVKFNGEAICLLATQAYGDEFYLFTFSIDGLQLGSRAIEINKIERDMLGMLQVNQPHGAETILRAVPGKGFAVFGRTASKKEPSHRIRLFDNKLSPVWSYSKPLENSKNQSVYSLLATENLLLNAVFIKAKKRKPRYIVEAINVADGSLAFHYEVDDGETSMRPEFALDISSGNEFVIAGPAAKSGVHPFSKEGIGITFLQISEKGELLERTSTSYETIAKKMGKQAEIHVNEGGELMIHRIVAGPDGGYTAIIEPYVIGDVNFRKIIKPTKWWKQSATDLGTLEDLLLVSFDDQYSHSTTKRIKVNRLTGEVDPKPFPYRPTTGIKFYWNAVKFTQYLPEEKAYVVGLRRHRNADDKIGEYVVVSDFGDGPIEKVIPRREDAETVDFVVGKPGYLLVLESLTDGSVNTRLEPVD